MVSITLGIRGLMVGSEADLQSHGLVKRNADILPESPILQLPHFQTLSLIAASSVFVFLAAVTICLIARYRRTKYNSMTDRVITVAPQLLNK